MKEKNEVSLASFIAILISILAFILYAVLLHGGGSNVYIVWIIMSLVAFVFPLVSKYIRTRNGKEGKGFEIAALVLGSLDFYFVIFAATKWNIYIAFAIIAIVCTLYAKLFND